MEIIRDADINDKYAIEELIKAMIGDENPGEVARSVVNELLSNDVYKVLVVEILCSVKGFVVAKINPFEGGNNLAEIVWLGITKQNKRTGLGTKLVQQIEHFLKSNNVRKIYVKTSVKNKSAICFWIMQDYKFEARLLDFSFNSFDDYYLGKNI